LFRRSSNSTKNYRVLHSLFETARRQGKKAQGVLLELPTKNTAHAQAALYRKPLVNSNQRAVQRC
jgi:hypothetical protein